MTHALIHHAYFSLGSPASVVPVLVEHIEQVWKIKAQGNPDFRIERYGAVGVDEARALKESAGRTAVTGGKKVFIVTFDSITREAQNALLKIVEEPPKDTHFFFILGSDEILLPTLRSRLEPLAVRIGSGVTNSHMTELVHTFIGSRPPARLKVVATLIKEVGDEDMGKGKLLDFLDTLERELGTDIHGNAGALREVLTAKQYSRSRAPSFKLLLEHLALVVPVVK